MITTAKSLTIEFTVLELTKKFGIDQANIDSALVNNPRFSKAMEERMQDFFGLMSYAIDLDGKITKEEIAFMKLKLPPGAFDGLDVELIDHFVH